MQNNQPTNDDAVDTTEINSEQTQATLTPDPTDSDAGEESGNETKRGIKANLKPFAIGAITGLVVASSFLAIPAYLEFTEARSTQNELEQARAELLVVNETLEHTQAQLLQKRITLKQLEVDVARNDLGMLSSELKQIASKKKEYEKIISNEAELNKMTEEKEKQINELLKALTEMEQ